MEAEVCKLAIIINGKGGSGKDTCIEGLQALYGGEAHVNNVSTIDPIKEAAKLIGWDGNKDDKSRKFLSDLKDALEEWQDIPFNSIRADYNMAKEINTDLLFIDAREPKDIERIKKEFNAKSILVHRDEVVNQNLSNHADSNVYETAYDYIIYNNADLNNLRESAIIFLEKVLQDI